MVSEIGIDARHTFRSRLLKAIGDEAVEFFEKTPVYALPPEVRTLKCGVYAIYYVGKFQHYQHVSEVNAKDCVLPIYVGKAVPSGWRKGRAVNDDVEKSVVGRLREHSNSIRKTSTLNVRDFRSRFIILDGVEADLIPAVEAVLIRRYQPLWNSWIDGFGNHTPGKGRFEQARSEWDVLHPGRPWADRCKGVPPGIENILIKIATQQKGLTSPKLDNSLI